MLSGRVAFVTGGGSGIGRATCQVLAREGAKVVVVDLNADMAKTTLEMLSGDPHSIQILDVTDEKKVESAVEAVIRQYNAPPTIVVNCAGIYIDTPAFNTSSENFDKTIKVNTKGTFNVIQITYKQMIKYKLAGSIINIGSVARKTKVTDWAPYAASKAAVHALTRSLATEMGKDGIRCNVIHPGLIETPLLMDNTSEEMRQNFLSQTALKRCGQPEEVAEVVAFLASEKSSYITGASIEVSGGMAI